MYNEPIDPLTGKSRRHSITASMSSAMGLSKSIITDEDEWLISPQPISVLLHKGVIIKPNSLSKIDISAAVKELREEAEEKEIDDELGEEAEEKDLSQYDAQDWIMRNNKFHEVVRKVIKIKQADVDNDVNQTIVLDFLRDYLTKFYGDLSIRMSLASAYNEKEYKKLQTYSEGVAKAENTPLFDKISENLILINFGHAQLKVPIMKEISSAAIMKYYYRSKQLLKPYVDEKDDKIPYGK